MVIDEKAVLNFGCLTIMFQHNNKTETIRFVVMYFFCENTLQPSRAKINSEKRVYVATTKGDFSTGASGSLL
jgi:hypothetical protein